METFAIASYVDPTGSGPRLTPDDPLERARMVKWVSVCSDYLYPDLVRALLKQDAPSKEVLETARRDLEVVDRQLQGRSFLLGRELCLCDLFLAPIIAYADGKEVAKSLFKGLGGIASWQDRLWSRPSFTATQS